MLRAILGAAFLSGLVLAVREPDAPARDSVEPSLARRAQAALPPAARESSLARRAQGAAQPPAKGKSKLTWAWQTPVRPPLPAVKNAAWIRNPIDSFVLARLEKDGLTPSA